MTPRLSAVIAKQTKVKVSIACCRPLNAFNATIHGYLQRCIILNFPFVKHSVCLIVVSGGRICEGRCCACWIHADTLRASTHSLPTAPPSQCTRSPHLVLQPHHLFDAPFFRGGLFRDWGHGRRGGGRDGHRLRLLLAHHVVENALHGSFPQVHPPQHRKRSLDGGPGPLSHHSLEALFLSALQNLGVL